MPLDRRDRRALLWGGAVVAILLLYLLLRGGDSGAPADRVQADIAATMPPAPPATYAAPVQPASVAAPTVTVAPSADVSQLQLYGILSRGAVIGMADGTQRFVPVGREIAPGVVLRRVDVRQVILG